jgi:hypothetical protein
MHYQVRTIQRSSQVSLDLLQSLRLQVATIHEYVFVGIPLAWQLVTVPMPAQDPTGKVTVYPPTPTHTLTRQNTYNRVGSSSEVLLVVAPSPDIFRVRIQAPRSDMPVGFRPLNHQIPELTQLLDLGQQPGLTPLVDCRTILTADGAPLLTAIQSLSKVMFPG